MIDYGQKSGKLGLDGQYLGMAYSGHNGGINNPAMEADAGVGPIPRGRWKIVAWLNTHPILGPCVAQLEPDGHDAHGRSGFFIHGDNARLNHSASHGCIVANRFIRNRLRDSGETELTVVA